MAAAAILGFFLLFAGSLPSHAALGARAPAGDTPLHANIGSNCGPDVLRRILAAQGIDADFETLGDGVIPSVCQFKSDELTE